jgi:hypothetical protein
VDGSRVDNLLVDPTPPPETGQPVDGAFASAPAFSLASGVIQHALRLQIVQRRSSYGPFTGAGAVDWAGGSGASA